MQLHFRTEGNGPPFIILHGLYGSSDNWLAISKKLAEKYTVYSVDLRNHGRSPHHENHTYEVMKSDLFQFFTQHKIEKAVILGHSMGGKTAMLFAADYPDLIEKLIVVDIAPKDYMALENESQYHFHRVVLLAMMEIDFAQVKTRQEVEFKLSEKIDNKSVIKFLLKNITSDRHSHTLRWKLNVEALYNNLEEIVEGGNYKRFEDRIPITSYPVIFIRGLKSPYIKENDIVTIKTIFPDSVIVDIPDAGHWLHAEQPELFLEAVMQCC